MYSIFIPTLTPPATEDDGGVNVGMNIEYIWWKYDRNMVEIWDNLIGL